LEQRSDLNAGEKEPPGHPDNYRREKHQNAREPA
jgi:hypothetical protein